MPIKSFKGKIDDGGQIKIPLSTNDGKTGYRITKFQTISVQTTAGGAPGEHYTFIWRNEQDSVSSTTPDIDFTDGNLLAVIWAPNNAERPFANAIIFDNEVFNQDIYITHMDIAGSEQNNFYIELEQTKLDNVEQTVATLQSIRSSKQGTGQKG